MNKEEINKLQLPCLLQNKPTGLIVRVEHINGNDGIGNVKYAGNSAYTIGDHYGYWNMTAFSMMDTNELYEDQ